MNYSWYALWVCVALFFMASFVYYPKYKQPHTEATLSWDACGYYYYLPAIFIYKDLKNIAFKDDIEAKYHTTDGFGQAFQLPNGGNWVMKYPIGQALVMSVPFFVAHAYCSVTQHYPADGFSLPYQFIQQVWAFLIVLLGLFGFRKLLLNYFNDKITALTLISICFATNYLEYGAIQNSMTHNALFTAYTTLILLTIQWYKTPKWYLMALIGGLIGWMTIIRPTEIIAVIFPALWGIQKFSDIKGRLFFFKKYGFQLVLAAAFAAFFVSIQLVYWKYVSGNWIVYSYENQGFSWKHPHIIDCLFDVKAGWLTYTPIMLLAIAGGAMLLFKTIRKQQSTISWFWAATIFTLLFSYICFAWDIWNYGGGVSLRPMVQAYPVIGLFLAWFYKSFWKKTKVQFWIIVFGSFCIVYNLWLHHQCHRGGLMYAGNMTKEYFWRILLRNKEMVPESSVKLLDSKYDFIGQPKDEKEIYSNAFEQDTVACPTILNGQKSDCMEGTMQYSRVIQLKKEQIPHQWLRLKATVMTPEKEWNMWQMFLMVGVVMDGDKVVKYFSIRPERLLDSGVAKEIYLDIKLPKNGNYTHIDWYFLNNKHPKTIVFDDLKAVSFRE